MCLTTNEAMKRGESKPEPCAFIYALKTLYATNICFVISFLFSVCYKLENVLKVYIYLNCFFPKNSFLKNFCKITMYLIVRFFFYICIIHILACFVFLVCRAFLTWASDSEDCANTSHVFDIK